MNERLAAAIEMDIAELDAIYAELGIPGNMSALDEIKRLKAALPLHDAPVECNSGAGAIPEGWKLVPIQPTDAMLDVALDAAHERVEPFTVPRESGVALECDISQEDCDEINAESKGAHRIVYCAMLAAAPALIAEKDGAP